MRTVDVFQICNGLGAGNIGDELMARAFWKMIPAPVRFHVPLFPESARQHSEYPKEHRYVAVDLEGNENGDAAMPGLLVGDTPVTANEGIGWPMGFLAPRLAHFHRNSLPVDAVGVGVDHLERPEAIQLFHEHFLPIRSWTVRSGNCRDSLLALGVAEERIRVGSDWAWLYPVRQERTEWAASHWRSIGIEPSQGLLVMNPINLIWRDCVAAKANVAAALDEVSRSLGLQIAFFCNECRGGDDFDYAAALQVQKSMMTGSVIVSNEYYSPDEAIALLRFATVTVAQRYHFAIQSILGGSVPVCIVRGQKMEGLVRELALPQAGRVESAESRLLFQTVADVVRNRPAWTAKLQTARRQMLDRARHNLDLIRNLDPYHQMPASEWENIQSRA